MKREVGFIVAIAALSGCGSEGPSLVPVSGTVTINGRPLDGAQIEFLPEDQGPAGGRPGGAKTAADGRYTATTDGRWGLVPGKYRAVVSKVNDALLSQVPETIRIDPNMTRKFLESKPKPRGAKASDPLQIEAKFEAEVPPSGKVLDFDVKAFQG